jgi:hypothetical protein
VAVIIIPDRKKVRWSGVGWVLICVAGSKQIDQEQIYESNYQRIKRCLSVTFQQSKVTILGGILTTTASLACERFGNADLLKKNNFVGTSHLTIACRAAELLSAS